jgi:fructose/tagatose bisphosphate aldolase
VRVPLVLHGASSIDPADLRAAIRAACERSTSAAC